MKKRSYSAGFKDGLQYAEENKFIQARVLMIFREDFKNQIGDWLYENIDRYDESIGLTKDEFIKEFLNFIHNEL